MRKLALVLNEWRSGVLFAVLWFVASIFMPQIAYDRLWDVGAAFILGWVAIALIRFLERKSMKKVDATGRPHLRFDKFASVTRALLMAMFSVVIWTFGQKWGMVEMLMAVTWIAVSFGATLMVLGSWVIFKSSTNASLEEMPLVLGTFPTLASSVGLTVLVLYAGTVTGLVPTALAAIIGILISLGMEHSFLKSKPAQVV